MAAMKAETMGNLMVVSRVDRLADEWVETTVDLMVDSTAATKVARTVVSWVDRLADE